MAQLERLSQTLLDDNGTPVGSALSNFRHKYHSIHVIHLEIQTELSEFLLLPFLRLFCLYTEPTMCEGSVPYDKRLIGINYWGKLVNYLA